MSSPKRARKRCSDWLAADGVLAFVTNRSFIDSRTFDGFRKTAAQEFADIIVRAAAPYGRFNDEMRRQADQLVITSRFRFTREDGLETSLAGN